MFSAVRRMREYIPGFVPLPVYPGHSMSSDLRSVIFIRHLIYCFLRMFRPQIVAELK